MVATWCASWHGQCVDVNGGVPVADNMTWTVTRAFSQDVELRFPIINRPIERGFSMS